MRIAILVSLLFFSQFSRLLAQTDYYTRHWNKVYKYELRALPKSALSVVDSIFQKAKADNNVPQITKALIYQSKFALSLQEDAELIITQRFKNEIAVSKAPLRNILESLLAELYWQYFNTKRYTYYERSSLKTTTDDFRTWDAESMFQEIHKHFQNSLTDIGALKAISLSSIEDILNQAQDSKLYRPTLFDFLSHNALGFYMSNEGDLARPHFNFTNEVLIDFNTLQVTEQNSSSFTLEALKIFTELLSYHKISKDPAAFVNLELERIQFILEQWNPENRLELHREALSRLKTAYHYHASSALIDFELASLLFQEGDDYRPGINTTHQFNFKEALAICEQTIAKFPQSTGSEMCRALKANILQKNIELTVEKFIAINRPSRILIRYSNVDSVAFSAYKVAADFEEKFFHSMNDSMRHIALAQLNPEHLWKVKLKSVQDYREHSTEVILPALSQGTYLVLAKVIKSPGDPTSEIFAYASIQVTNLVLVENSLAKNYRYQVLDRLTGAPIVNADVTFNSPDTNSFNNLEKHYKTNKDGFFEVKKEKESLSQLEAIVHYQNDEARFGSYYRYRSYESNGDEDKNDRITATAYLFTDRSIYRPGQTVYFKGIMVKMKKDKSSLVVGEYVEVYLEDVNSDEVGLLRLKTNSYGSFSGEFKLPPSGLTGEYTLYVDEDSEDSRFYDNLDYLNSNPLNISVEEYKRPTFEVSFKPVKESFKLYDTVRVHGIAGSFSGAKIAGAKVSYHVVRTVRFPHWHYWDNRNSYSDEEEISFGEVTSESNGEFEIKFKSLPDESVSKDELPVFSYEVKSDVTDINGETRSATTTVKVGYHTTTATLVASEVINRKIPDNSFGITVQNLNGEPVPLTGTVSIYKLAAPSSPERERPWNAPDLPIITIDEFKRLFPNDRYEAESTGKSKWKKGKSMMSTKFDTQKSKEVFFKVDKTWELGSYLIELEAIDNSGASVTDIHRFKIIESGNKKVGDNQLLIFELDKASYKVGDIARLTIGSASPNITLSIDVEKNHEIEKTLIEHLSGNVKEILIPITEDMNDGFAVHCYGAIYNSFLQETRQASIAKDQEAIEIETITFKDKLQPGAKETWSFEIKGRNSDKYEAEVLASMYDASLDQFKPHEWSFNLTPRNYYYSSNRPSANQSFREENFEVRNSDLFYYSAPKQYYDQLDWFGFSMNNSRYVNQQYIERLYSSGFDSLNLSKVIQLNNKNLRKGFIAGRITSGLDGSPLPGVNIVLKGTTTGTVTDMDGNYSIEASKGDALVYSFIGFSTAEATVGRRNVINVIMEEDVTQLSEIVVTALGVTVMKQSLSSAVYKIVSDTSLTESVTYEADANLAGAVAGIQITGIPGGTARLTIRGNSTANGNSEPLYVVDGVIVESSTIDQSDLASVQVFKGESAIALYGAKAANGVIVITTKSGQKKLDEELAKVNPRKNFNETAFFFPHLITNENGRVRFSFTTPESLTRWKLQLLAHTKELTSATKILQTVTQKELMVTPNAPRFLRVGDDIIFSTKISNLTRRDKQGTIALQLSNPLTGEQVDGLFNNNIRNQPFKISGTGSMEVSWKLKVPAGIDIVQYKVLAKAGNFSDGEQNALPILSNRVLVTETLPMFIKGGETKAFSLDKLRQSNSNTLQHHRLTLEVTSNPAWYAVQGLPYLMEFPHECAEQIFSRYYANSIASHIINDNPKIKGVFDQWSSSTALLSDLEKNQDLKSILIQETPWLRDAQSESEQKKRIALLFDLQSMKGQLTAALNKLQELQLESGGFTWFGGGRHPSRFITQHIASGFGHLQKLKMVTPDEQTKVVLNKAIAYLDEQILVDYNKLLDPMRKILLQAKSDQEGSRLANEFMEKQHINNDQIHYLYMRSFFTDIKISETVSPAIDYYRKQSARYWKEFDLYLKGMIALIHYRNDNVMLSNEILLSLKENSIMSEEMGMYWKENTGGWYWNEAPIETQALMIEAFAEIANNGVNDNEKQETIDKLRIWLLKNKQTSQWKTTKATTEAIYALLLNGTKWLSISDQVEVTIGNKKLALTGQPSTPEAGTGYFKTSWKGSEINSAMGEVKLAKKEKGIAWAGLYWQYFEDIDHITPAATPLRLAKKVFLVTMTNKGEFLEELNGTKALNVGDLLRIRIELSTDRPMEFLHMKDLRASGLEPMDVLSGYKWQGDLGYYQSTKDASTNFFFDQISKGVYVIEYDLRVNSKGNFSNGITTIQSMYAPEFSSHSEGLRISVE